MKRDIGQTLQLLADVVNAKGEDYTYGQAYPNDDSCTYFTGKPSDEYVDGFVLYEEPRCIVGHVFSRIGLHPILDENFDTPVDGVQAAHEEFTTDALAVLQAAQESQDRGAPWGLALQRARAQAEVLAEKK